MNENTNSNLTVTLVIEKVMPLQSGFSSASGKEWSRQEYVGKTLDTYPKTIAFSVMGAKINELNIQAGYAYDVHFNIDSRSYVDKNLVERWSTNINVWKAVYRQEIAPTSVNQSAPVQQNIQPPYIQQVGAAVPVQPVTAPQPTEALPF